MSQVRNDELMSLIMSMYSHYFTKIEDFLFFFTFLSIFVIGMNIRMAFYETDDVKFDNWLFIVSYQRID